MAKSKFDEIYKKNKNVFGNGKPEIIVEDILKYKDKGSVLDLGAGQGRNSLFLALHGFDVTALDVSEQGLLDLQEKAKVAGVKIKTVIADVKNFELKETFDVIILTFLLHFFPREISSGLIRSIQSHTPAGGLNAISAFTKDGDFYRNNPATEKFYLGSGELKELYSGWEILDYSETKGVAAQKREDGSPMFNIVANILARKI